MRKGCLQANHLHFRNDELVMVLTQYDLGRVSAVTAFDRGCKRSPKAKIVCDKGRFLLKRRASGKDSPDRIATSHRIQAILHAEGFPVAPLVGNRVDGGTVLVHDGNSYELFQYISGRRFHGTAGQMIETGAILARYHSILAASGPQLNLPTGGVHESDQVKKLFRKLVASDLGGGNEALRTSLQRALARLGTIYHTAATRVNQLGYTQWPLVVNHCDWHPGNLLFDNGRILAVLDHDSPRLQPRIADIASGMLQFSIRIEKGGKFDPSIDLSAARHLLAGYDGTSVVSVAEIKAIPWLMIEAIAARVAVGLASRIFEGETAAASLILMMDSRAAWLAEHAQSIIHEMLKPMDVPARDDTGRCSAMSGESGSGQIAVQQGARKRDLVGSTL